MLSEGHQRLRTLALDLPLDAEGFTDCSFSGYRLLRDCCKAAGYCWVDVARLLLCKTGWFRLDKHIFLLKSSKADLTGVALIYSSTSILRELTTATGRFPKHP